MGLMIGAAVPVGASVGVKVGVGLGVTGVLVGIGKGVSVGSIGDRVTEAVGEGSMVGGGGVQVGGKPPYTLANSSWAVDATVGKAAASTSVWQALTRKIGSTNKTSQIKPEQTFTGMGAEGSLTRILTIILNAECYFDNVPFVLNEPFDPSSGNCSPRFVNDTDLIHRA